MGRRSATDLAAKTDISGKLRAHAAHQLADGDESVRYPAPSEGVSIPYMLGTLRELVRVKLLRPNDVQDEFGKFAAVFRMGSAGLPHYEGQRRVRVRAITTDGIELTENHTAAEWLAASLRASD